MIISGGPQNHNWYFFLTSEEIIVWNDFERTINYFSTLYLFKFICHHECHLSCHRSVRCLIWKWPQNDPKIMPKMTFNHEPSLIFLANEMTCILKEIMIVFVELESVSLSDHLSFSLFGPWSPRPPLSPLWRQRAEKRFSLSRGVFTNLGRFFWLVTKIFQLTDKTPTWEIENINQF